MKYDVNALVAKEGQIIGKGKRDYLLFNYQMVGQRVYITFVENLGSKTPCMDLVFFESLTKDWHSHIAIQNAIRTMFHNREATDTFTFGKYKGQRYEDVKDLNYWIWLANKNQYQMEEIHIYDYELIHSLATKYAAEQGAVVIGGLFIDPASEKFAVTKDFEQVLENNEVFNFTCETNMGSGHVGRWLVRVDESLTNCYDTYYGCIRGLRTEDGRTKRAKGYVLSADVYDIDKENLIVTVKNFTIIGHN